MRKLRQNQVTDLQQKQTRKLCEHCWTTDCNQQSGRKLRQHMLLKYTMMQLDTGETH